MFILWSWWILLGRLAPIQQYAVLFVLILLPNTSLGQSALLTLNTIITLTRTESWGPKNRREWELSVWLSRDQHIVLLLSCERRDRGFATGLHSLTPHIFSPSPFPLFTPLIALSFSLPLFRITAHIWFWVKARLVSSGMEGLYFSMAPTPSPVSLCGEEYAVCLRTGVAFFVLILLNPHFNRWGTQQSSPINGLWEWEFWWVGGHQGFPVAPS